MLELLRAQFGVSLLLLEGGPTLFGGFVAEDCVDELFLTIALKWPAETCHHYARDSSQAWSFFPKQRHGWTSSA